MLLKTTGLLLAGLSLANAGIFQRQCLPSTITVTAAAAPKITNAPGPASELPYQTSTITLNAAPLTKNPGAGLPSSSSDVTVTLVSTMTETQTTTVFLPTITTTSTFTNLVTVQHTATVTQTVTGLSTSSPIAALSSTGSSTPTANSQFGSTAGTTSSASAANTAKSVVVVVSTAIVVPVPAPATQNNQNAHSTSSVPAVASTLAPTATSVTASTVFLTASVVTSSFPTLSVSGTMGITPPGFSGSPTAGSSGVGTAGTGVSSSTVLPLISVSSSFPAAPPFANLTTSGAVGASTGSSAVSNVPGAPLLTGAPLVTSPLRRRGYHPANRDALGHKRQVGAIVTATIDGVVVTWTNTWAGGVSSTASALASSTTPVTRAETAVQGTPVLVTATIDGVIVSWTASFALALTTSTSTIATEITALGGPVTVGPAPSQISPSIKPAVVVSTSVALPSSEPTAVLPTSAIFPSSTLSIAVSTSATPTSNVTAPVLPLTSSESLYTPTGVLTYHVPSWLASEVPFPPGQPNAPATTPSIPAPIFPVATTASNATMVTGGVTGTTSFTSTSVTTATFSVAASCTGAFSGNFTIDFDDLPHIGEPPNSDQYPPLQNPYHDLYWSQGFSYAPPPSDPYPPHSGSQLGVFVVDGNANVHSQNYTGVIPNDTDVNGMFGAGPNSGNAAFSIDAYGAYIGCQYSGTGECQIQVNGYALDSATGDLALQVEQYFYQAPCTTNCQLEYFGFAQEYRNLTALQVQVSVQGDDSDTSLTWYIDDISLAWTDNSCDAVQTRGQASGQGGVGQFKQRWNSNTKRESVFWQQRVPIFPPRGHELDA